MPEEKTDSSGVVKPLDFTGLILGFASAALYYLGDTSLSGEDVAEINLPLSLQNIEIIELLNAKTQGNLTPGEKNLIDDLLTDLRRKYQAKLKTPKPPSHS